MKKVDEAQTGYLRFSSLFGEWAGDDCADDDNSCLSRPER